AVRAAVAPVEAAMVALVAVPEVALVVVLAEEPEVAKPDRATGYGLRATGYGLRATGYVARDSRPAIISRPGPVPRE
ncbi:hypothetical protein, partial [Litchfieldella anticariensis]|uniref:hypothetical protein n=1 Tax=Litchfieldella anticariensis TaxID=258591 RepID=UPI00146F6A13